MNSTLVYSHPICTPKPISIRSSAAGTASFPYPARVSTASGSLYEVLKVKQSASPTEIKAAYRSLAKVCHPDVVKEMDGGRDFMEIHNAYATLADPAARATYDLSLSTSSHVGRQQERSSFNFNGYVRKQNSNVNKSRVAYQRTRRWESDQCW